MRLVAKPAAFRLWQICGNSPGDTLPNALSQPACLHRLRVCTAALLGSTDGPSIRQSSALITHGVALARLGKSEQAQFTLQRAFDTAHQIGAINKAGMAALTLIEEIEDLTPDVLELAYDRASEWLATSQSQEVLQRVIAVSKKIRINPTADTSVSSPTDSLLSTKCDLNKEKLKHERELISQALAKVGGRVTRAASLLGMSYQGLAYIIEKRHPDLLKERSPIRRRSSSE